MMARTDLFYKLSISVCKKLPASLVHVISPSLGNSTLIQYFFSPGPQAGLTLNPTKCEWARQQTWYLGYRLRQGEVHLQVDKGTTLWSFLGLVLWYKGFMPQFATIAAPLTALTGKYPMLYLSHKLQPENLVSGYPVEQEVLASKVTLEGLRDWSRNTSPSFHLDQLHERPQQPPHPMLLFASAF